MASAHAEQRLAVHGYLWLICGWVTVALDCCLERQLIAHAKMAALGFRQKVHLQRWHLHMLEGVRLCMGICGWVTVALDRCLG